MKFNFLSVNPFIKSHILLYGNSLAIWHGFPDITHIEVNNGSKSFASQAFWIFELKFVRAYPPWNRTFFIAIVVAIWQVFFSDILVNIGHKSGHFKFRWVEIFQGISHSETTHFVL